MSHDGQPRSGTPVLRRINTAAVLEVARGAAPRALRIAELAKLTGLTRPTVANAVEALRDTGWVVQREPDLGAPAMGRPALRYALNPRAAFVLGIDIGPHAVAACVADVTGQRCALERRTVPTAKPLDATVLLQVIDEATSAAVEAAGVRPGDISGIVAASPGIVDSPRGTVRIAPSVPGWPDLPFLSWLSSKYPCPAVVENDANAAAIEIAAGREAVGETILALQWGTRLGAGLIIEGRLHRGRSFAAGEIGFIAPSDSPSDTPLDSTASGPLEQSIGADGIVQRAEDAARRSPNSHLAAALRAADPDRRAVAVFDAAGRDPVAAAVVQEVAQQLARAIAPVVLALDPDVVVIGGGVARAGSPLTDAVSSELSQRVLSAPAVEVSSLVEDAVVAGAVRLALQEVWRRRMAL
ncbi:ROK family transcriptional regulator [Luteipulveratus mongoliensis]|uniref:ROK family transcriptional regulator n=1 Tax=Luteipulveratus mongoliensis TaxID=571913 RepID=UPI001C54D892|nr:ROK family transcriptional regulator [Luteipulveratus mongoliensis]